MSSGLGRTAFAGNVIPSGMINPTAAAIASFIPAPNQLGLVNNYISSSPFQLGYQKFDGRVDYHMSDHTFAFLRYGFSNSHAIETSSLGDVIGAGTQDVLADNAILAVDHAFGDNLITNFKFGYNRYDSNLCLGTNLTPLGNMLGMGDWARVSSASIYRAWH